MPSSQKHNDNQIRVLVFSKYEMVGQSLKCLIELNGDLTVTGVLDMSGESLFVDGLPASDVAVINFSGGERIDIISKLYLASAAIKVVVIIERGDMDAQAHALRLGAVGIVQKDQNPRLLIEAIRLTYR